MCSQKENKSKNKEMRLQKIKNSLNNQGNYQ